MSRPSKPVMESAADIAKTLDADPVLARQVKEHLSVERLLDLLELPKIEVMQYFDLLESDEEDE